MCDYLQLTDKYTTMNFNFLFQFLSELKENNTKIWFDLNRDRYKIIKEELESFTKEWIIELGKIDPTVGNLDAELTEMLDFQTTKTHTKQIWVYF